ncbi:MAG: glycosyltransferase family 2 protein [Proteobacteria bacterium]|nr:glycosyltransferase family 2 protein [Pseudomonadota bacterium]
MKTLQIIVPVFNEQEVVDLFYEKMKQILSTCAVDWTILFVDDGSGDGTVQHIEFLQHKDPQRVGLITLSRNFGKEYALTAGLDYVDADVVVVIDVDLQDPPELIPQMLDEWRNGFDVVYATRKEREGETFMKKATASWFYTIINKMSKISIPKDTGDYRLMDIKAVRAINKLRESNRFMKGLFAWIGYKQKAIYFDRKERAAGTTKFNMRKLFSFAIDGITSFSYVPLKFATWVGTVVALIAFLFGLKVIAKALIFGGDPQGYPTMMVIILFLGGIQLMALGIIGEYLGRLFEENKQRPLYLIDKYQPAMTKTNTKKSTKDQDEV